MRLPDFLIIGAMKSGTTTLYRDLETNPRIFFPLDKEPGNLCCDAVLTAEGRAEYASIFRRAQPNQICGEATTHYSKRPLYEGVAERAAELMGKDLKLIYIVREPVSRIVSQHHHYLTYGLSTQDIDTDVRATPDHINFSRYMMQLESWIEWFGPEAVRVLIFEEYVQDRRAGITEASRFLGIPPCPERIETDKVFNPSDNRPIHHGLWTRMAYSSIYRQAIRPYLPRKFKFFLFDKLLPKALPRPLLPTPETVDYLIERVQPDAERLRVFMGREQPLWDFDAVRRRMRAEYEAAKASTEP